MPRYFILNSYVVFSESLLGQMNQDHFFYDTTELVWLNYSLLRWVQTFPRTRSEYTTKFDFCTRGVTQKNKPCIFVLFQYLRLGRVFIFASWVSKAHNSPCGLVVGLIYSLRENKYSPLAQILKLDVKYHGLFFYSVLFSRRLLGASSRRNRYY